MKRVRVAYLQKAPSGHMDACLRALSHDAELFVTLPPSLEDAPYDRAVFDWPSNTYPLTSLRRDEGLVAAVESFRPDVTLVVGWEQRAYRRCALALRGSSLRVVGMDNQWLATPKQFLGIATRRIYLRPYFDAAFLPGRRQRDFALRLGFPNERIFEGFYAADVDAFRHVPSLGNGATSDRRTFVFIGRLVESKGVRVLLNAYAQYREAVAEPWPLLVLGAGPLGELASRQPGVDLAGFVEPAQLPTHLAQASFLVLPSTFEPWGVAVHEAVAAGLGCICSTAVGAADAFVRDRENGRIVAQGSVSALADALSWSHELSRSKLPEMSAVSRTLAERFTPERWAETVLAMAGL
ncbi:MAG: glycosyltransferase family 4 protein [Gaiellaceae bacterium]